MRINQFRHSEFIMLLTTFAYLLRACPLKLLALSYSATIKVLEENFTLIK